VIGDKKDRDCFQNG